jgi:hypothetical protein
MGNGAPNARKARISHVYDPAGATQEECNRKSNPMDTPRGGDHIARGVFPKVSTDTGRSILDRDGTSSILDQQWVVECLTDMALVLDPFPNIIG